MHDPQNIRSWFLFKDIARRQLFFYYQISLCREGGRNDKTCRSVAGNIQ
jgi:hypothetical protein